jgi:hypothetical protein
LTKAAGGNDMGYRPRFTCSCPFYEKEFRKGICCEGIANTSGLTINFNTEEEKTKYIKCNCIKDYPEECKIFQLLTEKYAAVD